MEESCSTSKNNVVYYDAIYQTEIAVANFIRVIMPIIR